MLLDQLDLVVLARARRSRAAVVLAHLLALEGRLVGDDARHLGLDGREVVLGERPRQVEVVVEAVLDRRADAELRLPGSTACTASAMTCAARVAHHVEVVVAALGRDDLDRVAVLEGAREVADLVADAHGHGGLRQARARWRLRRRGPWRPRATPGGCRREGSRSSPGDSTNGRPAVPGGVVAAARPGNGRPVLQRFLYTPEGRVRVPRMIAVVATTVALRALRQLPAGRHAGLQRPRGRPDDLGALLGVPAEVPPGEPAVVVHRAQQGVAGAAAQVERPRDERHPRLHRLRGRPRAAAARRRGPPDLPAGRGVERGRPGRRRPQGRRRERRAPHRRAARAARRARGACRER